MRGHPMAAANEAASPRVLRSPRNVASSLRHSTGRLAAAGRPFNPSNSDRVPSRPSFMAAASGTSTPGKPTFAARRAKSGHGTRFATSVLFKARYMGILKRKMDTAEWTPLRYPASTSFATIQRDMRHLTLVLLSLALLRGEVPRLPPLREQAEIEQQWLKLRLERNLPPLMRKHGVQMWLVLCREYAEDPAFFSLVSPTVF